MVDIRHFFIEKGQGEPLILLHGNGENSGYFENQIVFFAKQFHVFAPDTRGHGKTPRGDGAFTLCRFAEDLATFMEKNGLKKAHILGFSDGANIAMLFALRYPERVDRLIVDGGNLTPRGVKPRFQVPIELGYRIARLFAAKSKKARSNAEMLGLMVNEPNLSEKDLSRITAKTLVMAGTHDMIKTKETKRIAAAIPNAECVWIKGDHFIAQKNPEAFNRTVLDFLKKLN